MSKKPVLKAAEYLFLTLVSLIFVLPLLFLAAESVSGLRAVSFENYRQVLGKSRNLQAFTNGLKLSVAVSVLAVTVSLAAALALSRRSRRNSETILSFILLLSGLPFCTLVIPLYFVLFQVKLLDSLPVSVLFLTAANIPPNIWVLKKFIDSLPAEMEETARIDGSSQFAIFSRIVLPQLSPALTGTGITTFINCWGNFIVPFILLSSSDKLPTALAFFQVFSAGEPGLYGYLSAYAVLYFLPVLFLYIVLRLGRTRIFVIHRLKS